MKKFRIRNHQQEGNEYLYSDSFATLSLFFKEVEENEYDLMDLQSYSGLKDSNGLCIFEKDWIKHFKYAFEVCFYKGAFYGKQDGVEHYVLLNELNEHSEVS